MENQPQKDLQPEPNLQSSPSAPTQSTGDTRRNKIPKWVRLSLIPLSVIVVLAYGYLAYKTFFVKPVIKSYEECIKTKGSLIKESYPQVCVTKSGLIFTNEIVPVTIGSPTKAEDCYGQVINAKCPKGAQCVKAEPTESFCYCMGGSPEIREEGTEGQYDVCVINGEDYTDITFQDFEQGWYWGSYDQRKTGTPDNWVHSGEGTRSASWRKSDLTQTPSYLFVKSEGSCTDDTQCQWAGEGCGGGHGICTNNPDKYKNIVTTCDIVDTFPANLGYMCGCIETLNQCGWKR
ncbi:MAG: hypothetical protein ABIJ82_02735 [Patescibacteria group bacterium]|nr:hypothetical protein [Patescibacteria group bacterium]MBU1952605.1 hypothetical protein [Patescibacteria group bacterium]